MTIIHGSVSEAKTWEGIEDESVHLVVTSPPYDNLRSYSHGAEFDLAMVSSQFMRVLVPGGVVCWIVGDAVVKGSETLTSFRQAIHFVDVAGFRMHDAMIYERLNFSHPEANRYHQVFENMFVLSKGRTRVFNGIKDKPNLAYGETSWGQNSAGRNPDGSKNDRPKVVVTEFGLRTNVWRGKTRGQEEGAVSLPHPAMMPKWLARDLIHSWSNEGDTVLDPFAGSGTVPLTAKKMRRKAIAIDISEEYVNLIKGNYPLFTGDPQ